MSIEQLMKIFSGLAVPVIGFLGVYIAWKQWRTAAYRYKMDLFEKRFGVYEAILDFIMSIRGGGKISDQSLALFKERTLATRFLFDDEVADYVAEIRSRAIDIQTYSQETKGMDAGDEKIALQRKSSESRKWLYYQIDEKQLNQRFQKYLSLNH
ncbi:MAG: hypothetical protein VR64_21320 [Desulfatitalea sp. BRH_c12]|nr:MAG: hypothetical protein VR64_21320 [Desulfatitalea sp. BRH_c12]